MASVQSATTNMSAPSPPAATRTRGACTIVTPTRAAAGGAESLDAVILVTLILLSISIHMLRSLIGDAVFWPAVSKYLEVSREGDAVI